MKHSFLVLISFFGLISCSHHSFDPVSYYDVNTCASSCRIASDIRDDISDVHKKAFQDSLKITEDFINDDSGGWSYQETLYLELSKNYPRETVEIIENIIKDVYEDANKVALHSGLLIDPLISVSAIIETGLALAEIDERPVFVSTK